VEWDKKPWSFFHPHPAAKPEAACERRLLEHGVEPGVDQPEGVAVENEQPSL